MDNNGPGGVSQTRRSNASLTASTGDVDLDGALVGLVERFRENGTAFATPFPWNERPGFYERMEAAGQDPEAMRRLIAAGAAVLA